MSAALSSVPRRLVALAAVVALVVSLLFAGLLAPAANSAGHTYPSAVKKAFMKTCVPAAVRSSDGKLSKKQATTYCSSALACVEAKLSLKEFEKAVSRPRTANGKIVTSCEKKAIAKVLS
jgi:hypothetical protein